jgi:fatty-acyl-CoA synthase
MLNQGLGSWIHRRRIKSRGKVAIISQGTELTYDEFDRNINRLAHAFVDAGIRKGDRVAYLGENHPAFLEVFFAATQIGALFVPLNTRLAAPELHYALEDSGSRILVHADALSELAFRAVVGIDSLRLVTADGASSPESISLEAFRSSDTEFIDSVVDEEDAAIILYTSGTTGHPKGAVLLHRNLVWNTFNALVDYDITSTEINLLIGPMFHVAALGMGAFPVMLKGGTLILEVGFDAARVLSLIQQHRVTMMSGVPTTFQLLCEHPDFEATDLSSIRTLTCGGSAIPMRVLEAYETRGLSFTGGYGMTETSPGATSLSPRYSRSKIGSAGTAHFFTDVRIIKEDGTAAATGEIGEILIRGRNVIKEYWNRPDASRNSFIDGDWFRSGDMGYLDEDGFLFIADRLKDMIISGGENIYPAEIEQMIIELEHISGVALIGIPDEKWGEVPWAVVTVVPGTSTSLDEVRSHIDGRIARYKMPKNLIIVDEFPRTGSGKIRKADLRKMFSPN